MMESKILEQELERLAEMELPRGVRFLSGTEYTLPYRPTMRCLLSF
jgi:hypothetical protein